MRGPSVPFQDTIRQHRTRKSSRDIHNEVQNRRLRVRRDLHHHDKTSYPIIGLAFLRKHSAILDTAQGTLDFPQIHITLALKDERQKCNPKPITIKTEENHTIPAQATRILHASITVSNDHPITGTVQPIPQFDENAKLIVAPAITTARDKRVAIK